MTQLLFVRHAETDMAGTFCGSSNPPLNARGRSQVEKLASTLSPAGATVIYTSHLRRACQTAKHLATAFSLPLNLQPDLREIDFGAWETLRWTEIQARNPDYAQRWLDGFPNVTPPQGEAYADFQARVLQVVARLRATPAHQQAIVVTHAGVMRIVMQQLCGVDPNESWARTKLYCSTFLCPARSARDGAQTNSHPPGPAHADQPGKHP